MTPAADIARLLAGRIDQLVRDLLPKGHREGRTWRAGSVAGETGSSLSIDFAGPKRGLWHDFANEEHRGDALDLVKACLGKSTAEAIHWSECWLGIAPGEARILRRPAQKGINNTYTLSEKPPTWPGIWRDARPIAGTLAETYLRSRGLDFLHTRLDGERVAADPYGDVLRFDPRRARLKSEPISDDAGEFDRHQIPFEHHPALIALVRDVLTGEPCGLHNIYLSPDGSDRLRDKKGKTSTGRISGGAVMLGGFEDVTYGLTIAEGVETAIAVIMSGQEPTWVLCGAGNIAAFPVLPEIQSLTVAADTGAAGQAAAREVAARWRKAGREVRTITPPTDDWAANRKTGS